MVAPPLDYNEKNAASIAGHPVADPEFSKRGRYPHKWVCQPIIWLILSENCMKMKEIGPRGGALVPGAPLDLPMTSAPYFIFHT